MPEVIGRGRSSLPRLGLNKRPRNLVRTVGSDADWVSRVFLLLMVFRVADGRLLLSPEVCESHAVCRVGSVGPHTKWPVLLARSLKIFLNAFRLEFAYMFFVMKILNDILRGMDPDGAAAWSGVAGRVRPERDRVVELRPANDGGRRVVLIVPGADRRKVA